MTAIYLAVVFCSIFAGDLAATRRGRLIASLVGGVALAAFILTAPFARGLVFG
jgi:hypothetical protein